MRTRFVAGALALLWVASARAGQDAEPLAPVLARVADYVAEYQLKLAGTVGEERYRQDVRRLGRSGSWSTSGSQHREMRSDLLLVRPTGEGPWLQFRDVFEVDGKPVRDRDERLLTLFIDTTADAKVQAEQIAKEGARYNIGPVTRTINVPVLALAFFSREHQARSTFGRVGAGNLRRFAGLASEADVWAIQFAEVAASTLVRGEADKDLAARGRAWVTYTIIAINLVVLLHEKKLERLSNGGLFQERHEFGTRPLQLNHPHRLNLLRPPAIDRAL